MCLSGMGRCQVIELTYNKILVIFGDSAVLWCRYSPECGPILCNSPIGVPSNPILVTNELGRFEKLINQFLCTTSKIWSLFAKPCIRLRSKDQSFKLEWWPRQIVKCTVVQILLPHSTTYEFPGWMMSSTVWTVWTIAEDFTVILKGSEEQKRAWYRVGKKRVVQSAAINRGICWWGVGLAEVTENSLVLLARDRPCVSLSCSRFALCTVWLTADFLSRGAGWVLLWLYFNGVISCEGDSGLSLSSTISTTCYHD